MLRGGKATPFWWLDVLMDICIVSSTLTAKLCLRQEVGSGDRLSPFRGALWKRGLGSL